jgi:hypothetical protein
VIKAFEEPDKGVEQGDPEEDDEPCLGEDAGEPVICPDVNFVAPSFELNGQMAVVVCGFDSCDYGCFESREVPAVDDLNISSAFE